ncbi:PaaI family thioesterase [Marinoscillum sp. MHG1-6]|uniref:PaaI family thioesterase n=1 Tax=Marinoscillum sp. MHG1-6 TaxID=2959627 RepID=UPI002157C52D|nr:PaaI family thioesterase [Marinoscillum sp. MHG1-6]
MGNKDYFQDHMPENVCFGCGKNHDGLQIKSYWEGEESVCRWDSEEKYHGWANLLNGGILATLVDCHCMGTAIAHAYRLEERDMDSKPVYRYATGTLTVKYLQPTPNDITIELRAKVIEVKGRKTVMECRVFSDGIQTAQADVVAIRVFDSSESQSENPFK